LKNKIEINVYTFTDSNGDKVYDFESMAEEFEDRLCELDENLIVMCSIDEVNPVDDLDNESSRLEMEELKAKQYILNQKEDGTIALA